jgi:NAD(P)-dependent dehydrogenase (short-subunit alcohol dehydrogenase family)
MPRPQRIFIVGGASGIGAALTIFIIKNSTAQVFCFDKSIDYSASGPLGTLLSYPNRMYGHEGDVTIPDEREHAIATCIRPDVLGGIDTVVYCAGIITPIQRIENLDMESVEMTFSVNVFGAMAIVLSSYSFSFSDHELIHNRHNLLYPI